MTAQHEFDDAAIMDALGKEGGRAHIILARLRTGVATSAERRRFANRLTTLETSGRIGRHPRYSYQNSTYWIPVAAA